MEGKPYVKFAQPRMNHAERKRVKPRVVGKNKLVDRGRRRGSARRWWSYRTGLDGKLMLFDRAEIHSGLDPKEPMTPLAIGLEMSRRQQDCCMLH